MTANGYTSINPISLSASVLVVIDTLGKVAPRRRRSGYLAEYEILAGLKAMADRRRVSVVAVTHLRKKASAGDWTDDILGSSAVSGAADCLLHLSRPRGNDEAVLRVTGRDVEEREVPLLFNRTRGTFELVRKASSPVLSPERQAIRTFVEAAPRPRLAVGIDAPDAQVLVAGL